MEDKNIIVLAAIAGLVILEAIAILNGINGTMLKIVIAAVAGLGGWTMPFPTKK